MARTPKTAAKNSGANLGFEAELFKIADKLRGNMEPSDYKHVVLGLIFLKYISDSFEAKHAELMAEYPEGAEDKDEYAADNIYWVPKDARWSHLQANAKQPTIGRMIDEAMIALEANNEALKGVLSKDYARPSLNAVMLGELIDMISGIRLKGDEGRSTDVLGRVYEYFLGQFAGSEGKRGGEFYTPRSVVQTMVAMLEPYKGRIYDPCCGSGGMFVQSEGFVEEHGGRKGDIAIYGQESNHTTWRLCKMNLAVRGIDSDIKWNSEGSFHRDELRDLKADYILANPPFNISDWGGDRVREDVRWKYGTPPAGNANFAWLQHIVHHLAPSGVAGVVLANGSMSSTQSGEGDIGIAQSLKNALGQYSKSDQEQAGIEERVAVGAMVRAYEVVKAMFHGFDYETGLGGTPHERLVVLAGAIEWILTRQHEDAAKETTDEGKKRAHLRFQDGVLNLSKAFALSAGSDEAKAIAMEVGFFQAVRAALVQTTAKGGKSSADREFAIQQILNRAVVSTEIVDILKAAGLQTPDISILSDQFLAEVQQMAKKNLALEALKKLLNGEIHAKTRTNVVETKRFSERLEEAIARYHANAITTAEVIQELINLAHDVRDALNRGEEEGLTAEEIAFYDALAENNSAVEMMGNDALKIIAHELLVSLKGSVTVDWSHRESARAKMRVLVKRILRKYGFPPDLQDGAVQTVLRQAEALSASWVG